MTLVVLLVKSAGNTLLSSPKELDLFRQIDTTHRKISAILDPLQSGIDPTDFLVMEAA
jgi:hypothetical protein